MRYVVLFFLGRIAEVRFEADCTRKTIVFKFAP
jgi:hypothetical protein